MAKTFETLDEAIQRTEELAGRRYKHHGSIPPEPCSDCHEEWQMISDWLKDYKRLKSHESHTTCYKEYAYCEGGGYQVIYGDRFCKKMEKPMSREEFQTWIDTYITGDKA